MDVAPGHIHLFVPLPFDLSVSKAFRLFKGRSAHELFAAFPSFRKIFRKGHFFKEPNHSIKDAEDEAVRMRLSAFC
jgi:REP element-mobilizing transposase RayT